MVRAALMGSHSHDTASGVRVHVWQRAGNFLARGSYLGQRFGETLGRDTTEATARLRRLLNEIEDGSYVRPSDARQRPLSKGRVPRLTLRQLCNRGYGRASCPRFPQTAQPDAVRFHVARHEGTTLEIQYIFERDCWPLRHGELVYCDGNVGTGQDAILERQAIAFAESYLRRAAM